MTNAGSQWRKWNFHVHTKGTNKNDQFSSASMDEFFCVFFKKAVANGVNAIGITDYFSIERYLDAVEYQKNVANKVDVDGNKLFVLEEISFIREIFLFPNVELRMLPSTDSSKLINIHCLFNPDYVSSLDHDFFSSIRNQESYQMTRHGITMYGSFLNNSVGDENAHYKKGVDNYLINVDALKQLLNNKRFADNALLVVSNSNKDGASGFQKHYDLFENEGGKFGRYSSVHLLYI